MIAPFTPFLAETLWQHLKGDLSGVRESVHLCDMPTGRASEGFIEPDAELSERMTCYEKSLRWDDLREWTQSSK